MAKFEYVDVTDFKELEDKCKTVKEEIRKLEKEHLTEAADEVARAIKLKLSVMPAHGTKQTGLRYHLIAGLSVEGHKHGASVVQSSRFISGRNARALPRDLDEGTFFRHPIYGKHSTIQRGYAYFQKTAEHMRPDIDHHGEQITEDLMRYVADYHAGPGR